MKYTEEIKAEKESHGKTRADLEGATAEVEDLTKKLDQLKTENEEKIKAVRKEV